MKTIQSHAKNGFKFLLGASTLLLAYPLTAGAVPETVRTTICNDYAAGGDISACVAGFNEGYQTGVRQVQASTGGTNGTQVPDASIINQNLPNASSEYRTGYTSGYRIGVQDGFQNNRNSVNTSSQIQ